MKINTKNISEGSSFGDRLRFSRKESGLSQDELARQLGYKTPISILKAEKNKGPLDQEVLSKIADVLEVDLHWLITGKPSPGSDKLIDLIKQMASKFSPCLADHYLNLQRRNTELQNKLSELKRKENPTREDKAAVDQLGTERNQLFESSKQTLEFMNWLQNPFETEKEKN